MEKDVKEIGIAVWFKPLIFRLSSDDFLNPKFPYFKMHFTSGIINKTNSYLFLD